MISRWLAKVAVALAVAGVILFDVGSIAVNFFGLDSVADTVVSVVSTEVSGGAVTKTDQRALEDLAQREATKHGAKVTDVAIDTEGRITLKVKRTADTLIVSRIDAIHHWGRATASGHALTE